MTAAVTVPFDYNVRELRMAEGTGHRWVGSSGYKECYWCGTRSHWPGAETRCSAQKDRRSTSFDLKGS